MSYGYTNIHPHTALITSSNSNTASPTAADNMLGGLGSLNWLLSNSITVEVVRQCVQEFTKIQSVFSWRTFITLTRCMCRVGATVFVQRAMQDASGMLRSLLSVVAALWVWLRYRRSATLTFMPSNLGYPLSVLKVGELRLTGICGDLYNLLTMAQLLSADNLLMYYATNGGVTETIRSPGGQTVHVRCTPSSDTNSQFMVLTLRCHSMDALVEVVRDYMDKLANKLKKLAAPVSLQATYSVMRQRNITNNFPAVHAFETEQYKAVMKAVTATLRLRPHLPGIVVPAIVIHGEPGVGKTRLFDYIVRNASPSHVFLRVNMMDHVTFTLESIIGQLNGFTLVYLDELDKYVTYQIENQPRRTSTFGTRRGRDEPSDRGSQSGGGYGSAGQSSGNELDHIAQGTLPYAPIQYGVQTSQAQQTPAVPTTKQGTECAYTDMSAKQIRSEVLRTLMAFIDRDSPSMLLLTCNEFERLFDGVDPAYNALRSRFTAYHFVPFDSATIRAYLVFARDCIERAAIDVKPLDGSTLADDVSIEARRLSLLLARYDYDFASVIAHLNRHHRSTKTESMSESRCQTLSPTNPTDVEATSYVAVEVTAANTMT